MAGPRQVPTYGSETLAGDQTETSGLAAEASLYDDVTYTFYVLTHDSTPTLALNGLDLSLQWVSHGGGKIGTAQHIFRQVGMVEVWLDHRPTGMRFQVGSRKLDYQTDYRAMVQELEAYTRGLAAQLAAHALGLSVLVEEATDFLGYWIAVLVHIWRGLRRDIEAAWRTLPPHLSWQERTTDVFSIKRPSAQDMMRVAASGNPRQTIPLRQWERLTPERLYILQLLHFLHRQLDRLDRRTDGRMRAIQYEAASLLQSLGPGLSQPAVARAPEIPATPLAQSHPALREVVRWHRWLNRGLFPDVGPILVAMKDVNVLYEYWCYLTIVRVLVEESQGRLEVEPLVSRNPLDVILRSGLQPGARVTTAGGSVIHVFYEPRFDTPTVSQQPDNLVRLVGRLSLLFDAKYRFELNPASLKAYSEPYGVPIPPVDAIHTMHRYRDAIVVKGKERFVRLVDQAIVLFPLPAQYHQAYRRHRFYDSLDDVGIGAIPLIPGHDEYLRDVIRAYLSHEASESDARKQ
ncbi:MAG: nuclease domain-containing protein [Firmicutes bacterium]|nr:nuclease domain-containing protein [Bacillota bacterium]